MQFVLDRLVVRSAGAEDFYVELVRLPSDVPHPALASRPNDVEWASATILVIPTANSTAAIATNKQVKQVSHINNSSVSSSLVRNPALAVMNKNKDFEGSNFEPVNDGPSTAQIAASIAAHYETKELDRKDTDIIPFGLEDIIIQRRRRRCGDIYFVISLFVFDFCFL